MAVAAVGGKLLAVGGWDGRSFLASVECYEPAYGPSLTLAVVD